MHEDNDMLTIMSPEEYTHFKPRKAFLLFGCSVAIFLGSVGLMGAFWVPPAPFVRREFEGGLEKELGGPNTLSVSYSSSFDLDILTLLLTKEVDV